MRIGVAVTARQPKATVTLTAHGQSLGRFRRDLAPDQPFVADIILSKGVRETDVLLRATDREGQEIISYQPKPRAKGKVPPPATEPPAPADIAAADELFVTGLHLDQYRHATRCPTLYWREALCRDPLDSRCNNAMGLWHLKRGEFRPAETHFRRAIERLTQRNANPYDGEPYYNLGLCLRHLGQDEAAYAAFYKATWNQAWAGAAYHALAEIDCCRRDWDRATEHIEQSCRAMGWNPRAMNLCAMVLCRQKRFTAAEALLKRNQAKDPLDWWTRSLLGEKPTCDMQTLLDVALGMARAGFFAEAIKLLGAQAPDRANGRAAHDPRNLGAAPLVHYYLGWLHTRLGDRKAAVGAFKQGAAAPPDYCFPARLEEIAILEAAMAANPKDARAPYYFGNLLYDRRRHAEAIRLWERSARLDPTYSVVWRNLGIGHFNIRRNAGMARAAYDKAFRVNPTDARLLFERDQLWKQLGEKPARRLRQMEKRLDLVRQRDDLTVELCALYNQTGRHADALTLVSRRHFQPWEGGEGGPLGQWVRSHLALGRAALRAGQAARAREHFEAALTAPHNLGEAKHLLANQSDIHYWLGRACDALGDRNSARQHWLAAATFKGDFQEMSVRAFSEMTFFSAWAWERLGQAAKATKLFADLLAYSQNLQETPTRIDYFATSLPTMLLFDDDLQVRQETTALFLQAQAHLGLKRRAKAKRLLAQVLNRDPSHALAADLLAEWKGTRSGE